jgi:hypothetical protein
MSKGWDLGFLKAENIRVSPMSHVLVARETVAKVIEPNSISIANEETGISLICKCPILIALFLNYCKLYFVISNNIEGALKIKNIKDRTERKFREKSENENE